MTTIGVGDEANTYTHTYIYTYIHTYIYMYIYIYMFFFCFFLIKISHYQPLSILFFLMWFPKKYFV